MHPLAHAGLMAGITWDPFIRGFLIVVAAVVLLPGSVYLVLATDTGARLGFLLAAAGLMGLLSMMAVLWLVLASTAAIGRPNSWRPLQVVTGDFAGQVTVKDAQDFPANELNTIPPSPPNLRTKHWFWPLQSCRVTGWHKGDPAKITDPESASDTVLASAPTSSQLKSPFSVTTDYTYAGVYEKGTNAGCLFAVNRHKIYLPFTRTPHLAIVVAYPVIPQVTPPNGAPPTPKPDLSKPPTYVILERNLGSVRQPQFVVAVSSGLIFLILCNMLHRRDKEIWARKAAEQDAVAGAGPGDTGAREKVGAST